MPCCLLIAGTASGVGKTTIALGIMAALRRGGLIVQPFKVGPDFIDPGHHTAVCGRVSRNLDTWMLSADVVRSTFWRAVHGADVAIIEGVMGLFDGRGPDDLRGSSADVARLLGVPVVLVVDAAGAAASVAAVVKGFAEFDPTVHIAGVICNRVAGPRHYAAIEPALRRQPQTAPLGYLARDTSWNIPQRHLGLITAIDLAANDRWDQLAQAIEATINLDQLLRVGCQDPYPLGQGTDAKPLSLGRGVGVKGCSENTIHSPPTPLPQGEGSMHGRSRRVAVARDAAFCFYYPENLELLEQAGATLVPFSPLADADLPADVDLIYLGGGYPELHAAQLAANTRMRQQLRQYHCQGGAIYAECGGLMYTCRELVDQTGTVYPMLDLLPARASMQQRLAALGYITWRATSNSLLGAAGTKIRGHEFHYSRLEPLDELRSIAELHRVNASPRPDGFIHQRLLAGYAHLHFGSNPSAATALLS